MKNIFASFLLRTAVPLTLITKEHTALYCLRWSMQTTVFGILTSEVMDVHPTAQYLKTRH